MKKIALLVLSVVPLFLVAQVRFNIKGEMPKKKELVKIYINYSVEGNSILDSTNIKNGKFNFKGTFNGLTPAHITVDYLDKGHSQLDKTSDILSFYLDDGQIKLKASDSIKNASITKSAINKENEVYINYLKEVNQQHAMATSAYMDALKEKNRDLDRIRELSKVRVDAANNRRKMQIKFIQDNPSSIFSISALRAVGGINMKAEEIQPLFEHLSEKVKNSETGQVFSKRIETARMTGIGAYAMDFTQNDTLGNPVSLSDFKGKYVLIDFWASWCGPCRAENPNVVKAFNSYNDKGFTVLGISLDRPGKKQAWLDAIRNDGLTWTQLSDLKYWDNEVAVQYGIKAVPQNLLIDPTGKIIAKNLRGEQLHKKLAELIK